MYDNSFSLGGVLTPHYRVAVSGRDKKPYFAFLIEREYPLKGTVSPLPPLEGEGVYRHRTEWEALIAARASFDDVIKVERIKGDVK